MAPAETEATVFGRYLVGQQPAAALVTRYAEVIEQGHSKASEKSLLAALQHPFLLPYLDAYDALFRPQSQLRQRLYLMFSILEASPDYAAQFLPQQRSLWYVFVLAGAGARGVARVIVGFMLVKLRSL